MKFFSNLSLLLMFGWSSLSFAGSKELPAQALTNPILSEGDSNAEGILTLTIDASDKTNFVYLGLEKGKLLPVSEKEQWIFGVRRYIFKTATGANGESVGGAAVAAGEGFESFGSCSSLTFEADQEVTMFGYTIAANALMTSEWFGYSDEGAVTPMDKFFAISRDNDCLKVRILAYQAGVYSIEYSQIREVKANSVPERVPELQSGT